MADFLEGLGGTNTLRAVTSDISNLAVSMRTQDQQDRVFAVEEADALMKQQAFKEEREKMRKPVPIDTIKGAFPVPAVAEYAQKMATSLGLIEEVDGVPIIRAGDAQKMYQLLHEGDNPKIISALTSQHFRTNLQQVKDQLTAYQQKNAGKDLSQDKNYLALAQAAKQAQQGLVQALDQSDKLKQYYELAADYTPESVQQFMESGEASSLVPKVSKKIEHIIDLGNAQRVIYTDGSEKDLPKAASPSTIIRDNARSFTDEQSMRKEFQSIPEVKEFPVIESQIKRLDKAMEESRSGGSMIAVDQALITILNKMLDPASVVRESEYARTPQDMALLNKVKGNIDKLSTGGAGLTAQEREAISRMSRNFYDVAADQYNQQVGFYGGLANEYGFKPENVVRLGGKKAASGGKKESSPQGDVVVTTPDGKRFTFPDAAAAQAFKKAAGI